MSEDGGEGNVTQFREPLSRSLFRTYSLFTVPLLCPLFFDDGWVFVFYGEGGIAAAYGAYQLMRKNIQNPANDN